MGFFSSFFKKVKKTIKKPLSKITKGIARGVAKVGKAVMKGVSSLGKKFGPLGMIAMAVAMPYALSALGGGATGGLIGRTMMGPHGQMMSTGWLNSSNVFLKSIGQIGNTIRTGYTASTGKITDGWKSITNSISEGFSSLSENTGNVWKNISKGAKNLFKNSRTSLNTFKKAQGGTVKVSGWGNPFGYADTVGMTAEQAAALIQPSSGGQALLKGSQLSAQTLGSSYDKLISDTINKSMQPRIDNLSGNSKRYFNDMWNDQVAKGIEVNKQETFNAFASNKGTTLPTDFSSAYETNLANTGDYAYHAGTKSYNFTGGSTYNNTLGNKYINKKTANTLKKTAFSMADSLLQAPNYETPEVMYEVPVQKDMTMNTATSGASGTNLKGAYGTNYFNAVFGNAAWDKLKNSYKYMNI